jgi:hypothetical protein
MVSTTLGGPLHRKSLLSNVLSLEDGQAVPSGASAKSVGEMDLAVSGQGVKSVRAALFAADPLQGRFRLPEIQECR